MGKFTEDLNRKLLLTEKRRYHRDQLNTYMNTFEWENVEDAKRIGLFLGENKSFFYFPFISRAYNLLSVTIASVAAANRYQSKYKILSSEYGLMAAFINFFNILEFVPKGIAGFFARWVVKEDNKSEMQQQFAKHATKYGSGLETIPFYDHDYHRMRSELSVAYQAAKTNQSLTFSDRLTYFVMSTEWWMRAWVSKPLQWLYHQPDNIVPPTTDIIVRYRVQDAENEVAAKKSFLDKLNEIKTNAKVDVVHDHVYSKPKKPNKNYISTYALLSAPRYRDFINTTKTLDTAKIEIKKIAGNDNIQVKCEIDANSNANLTEVKDAISKITHANFLYQYGDSINPYRRTCLFDVPVEKIQKTVRELDKVHDDVKVSFIHNF